jgi:penicillin-binding protein 1A
MAGTSKSRTRVEPSFDGGQKRGGDDFRVSSEDRVTGNKSGSGKSSKSKSGRQKTGRSPRRGGSGGGGIIGWAFGLIKAVIYWALVAGLWGGMAIGGIVLYYGSRMPNADTWSIPERPPNIKIVAVDGSIVANRGSTGGEAQALSEMSPYIPQAVIAIEDRRFYTHFGVDPIGLARAMVTNVLRGHMVQGGSTLTQQLAKNLFLSPDRTFERKVQEVLLAFWLEHKFTKDQILALYLNRVFFGSNAYGVEAASRRYFNKSARDVTLKEAATLAGLLKAPTRLSPARDPVAAEVRAQVVLGAMREAGFISDREIASAISQTPVQAKSALTGGEHYVADMVMEEVKSLVGEVKEDLVVDTTLDMTLERKATDVVRDAIDRDGAKLNVTQGALVSIDGTGAIRALVGGRDYAQSQFNRAFKAKRQPGSAFKPFVYAAALERGLTPDTVRNDTAIRIGNWTPENYDEKYHGPVTLKTALANSLNTIAAQLTMEVSPKQVAKVAHRLGIESDLEANASIALGTSEVSLTELTAAYAPFMNGGYKATPHLIQRITTASGKVLFENVYDNPPRVLSEQNVSMMNQMMMAVISEGTGKKAKLPGWQVAGKTGTTQSFKDALFVGFSSNITTGVWFGNDDGNSMKKVTGGGLPAMTWSAYMIAAHEGLSPSPLFGTVNAPGAPPASTIGDLISGVFGGDTNAFPPAPAAPVAEVPSTGAISPEIPQDGPALPVDPAQGQVIQLPEAETVDSQNQALFDNGLIPPENVGMVPPADVGSNQQQGQQPAKKTTLMNILLGQ